MRIEFVSTLIKIQLENSNGMILLNLVAQLDSADELYLKPNLTTALHSREPQFAYVVMLQIVLAKIFKTFCSAEPFTFARKVPTVTCTLTSPKWDWHTVRQCRLPAFPPVPVSRHTPDVAEKSISWVKFQPKRSKNSTPGTETQTGSGWRLFKGWGSSAMQSPKMINHLKLI